MNTTIDEATKMIISFARLQTTITHQANSRRGVTMKSVKEERLLIGNLLDAMGVEHTKAEIDEICKQTS